MKFADILPAFKDHKYIRREAWNENLYVQLIESTGDQVIRLVLMRPNGEAQWLQMDARINAIDLISEDWEEYTEGNVTKIKLDVNLETRLQLLTVCYLRDIQNALNRASEEEKVNLLSRHPEYMQMLDNNK